MPIPKQPKCKQDARILAEREGQDFYLELTYQKRGTGVRMSFYETYWALPKLKAKAREAQRAGHRQVTIHFHYLERG